MPSLSTFSEGAAIILAQSAVAIPSANSTAEQALLSVPIPAGLMGANGRIEIDLTFGWTNSANNKTYRVRLGNGLSGKFFVQGTVTTSANSRLSAAIMNRGSQSSQVAAAPPAFNFGNSIASLEVGTIDTSQAQTLTISVEKALGTETATLEAYLIRLFPKV